MKAFQGCEYVVLEAGLGGEFDAPAVFKKELTLVTPIDLDHQAFLGSDIISIAKTKLNAIQKKAIISKQKHKDVYEIASKIENIDIEKVDDVLDQQDSKKIAKISKKLKLASYLVDNLSLAISALKHFEIEYKEDDFDNAKLFGRLTKIDKNIIIDVGHNPLAASSIVKELANNEYTLVYNSYKDKDYKMILSILKPIINEVELISIEGQRVEDISYLHKALNDLKIKYSNFCKVRKDKEYLVFGSFSVVEQFLKEYNI
jgi:dihydrofolate synthase/folylpolyglutamate synthase